MTDRENLIRLIEARNHCIHIPTFEEEHAMILLRALALEKGTNLGVWNYTLGVHDGLVEGARGVKDTESPAGGLFYLLSENKGGLIVLVDMIAHLEDARVLRLLRDLIEQQKRRKGHIFLLDHSDTLPDVIGNNAATLRLSLPDENELVQMIKSIIRRENDEKAIDARISSSALRSIVKNLLGLTRTQAERVIVDVVTQDRRFSDEDLNRVVARKRQMLHRDGLLEYVESLATLDEIAGLQSLKTWLDHRQHAMADAKSNHGLNPPRGILMLGVPGAGKSLCAKAVATAWQRPLLRLDPGVLYDRYIGETERRLREALQQAEAMSPNVLWIDEIEKGLASAASQSTDGGLSRRMFGTMLTWMQEHTAPVFLIATANDIQALPAELLRKGRFDEIFFVDLPSEAVRKDIFKIHLSKRGHNSEAFDTDMLAAISSGFTGSEIEQAIVSAKHDAYMQKHELSTQHVEEAVKTSPPLSVTMAEYVGNLRLWAEKRCVPAD